VRVVLLRSCVLVLLFFVTCSRHSWRGGVSSVDADFQTRRGSKAASAILYTCSRSVLNLARVAEHHLQNAFLVGGVRRCRATYTWHAYNAARRLCLRLPRNESSHRSRRLCSCLCRCCCHLTGSVFSVAAGHVLLLLPQEALLLRGGSGGSLLRGGLRIQPLELPLLLLKRLLP